MVKPVVKKRDLLGFVMKSLRDRHAPLTDVARASGVPYDTLKKIASGATPNPGVKHVQALADFFDGIPAGPVRGRKVGGGSADVRQQAHEVAHG